ncbi:MAG: ABC transporter substrate-binding protein [Gaiella sp.]
MGRLRLLVVGVVVLLAAIATGVAAAQDKDRVVFTIGLINDVESLNPLIGVEVPDYEVWNLQYATLTSLATDDFAATPGLAESWEASADGKTYTYKLRDGLKWSDDTPLTAEDIAYTLNRAKEEGWLNYETAVANSTAKAIDDTTLEIVSSVPDPKLPNVGAYILPKHIWEKYDEKAVTKYDALDGVGSGPFTLAELKRGQFWRLVANDNYYGGRPVIDEVIFRLFNNADAMAAALEKGEIDAAHGLAAQSMKRLEGVEGIVTVVGEQGGFNELSVNGGRPEDKRVEGIGNGHPALSNLEFRKAIAHSIDKQTIVDKVLVGLGRPGVTMSPSPLLDWQPEIPVEEQYAFDLEKAKSILEAAGFTDGDGDGIRELDGENVVLDYVVRSESTTAAQDAEFISGWLTEVGIGTKLRTVSDSKLGEIIGKGEYDMFEWGWTPFVDPDFMLDVFTCKQLSQDPDDPTNYYNDANWCDPAYDTDYELQKVELDPEKRKEIAHRMIRALYDSATYHVLFAGGDYQAYRTDRFEGYLRQPANTGPVLFSNSSPSYVALKPVGSSADGGGGLGTGGIIGIVVAAAAALGALGFAMGRRKTSDERE